MEKKIRKIYWRVKDNEFEEPMAVFKATENYGAKSVVLTREDLCIIKYLMEEAQNRANNGECALTMGEIVVTWLKMESIFD